MYIDTHAHLYLPAFDADRDAVLASALAAGVERIYLPNIDLASVEPMLALSDTFPQTCYPMLGLHPCSVGEDFRAVLRSLEEWWAEKSFCAVGEIGMDLHWDKRFRQQQAEAFLIQTRWAMDRSLPIVIHSRDATEPLIELLEPLRGPALRGVFHCFSGTADQARRIVGLGFLLGIGGVLTYKKSDLPAALADIPLDALVLETDAPYLPPVPHRGKRNESAYLPLVAERLSALYGIETADVAAATTRNALRLFG
ncbi:MAG: hypothetical protein RLY31_2695 [Bacteroidota bacterium]|jgi:TatD DNase family protein